MVHYDRRRGLFRRQLKCRRELDAQRLGGGKELEELRVSLEIGTGGIAPRVALALAPRNPKLTANRLMHPLRRRLGRFHSESVQIVRLGELTLLLELGEATSRFIAHGHDLERGDVHVARLHRAEVVRETEMLASLLPREGEARELAHRAAIALHGRGIVDDEIVAARLHWEIAVHRLRCEPALALGARRKT